jgi:hypothetical protein
MKQVYSFIVKPVRPRNLVAQALLDRNGEFKPKSIQKAKAFKRKPKHVGRDWE